jgi:hypothetical protein
VALAVSDRATDRLGVLFGTDVGWSHLSRRGVPDGVIDGLPSLGLSSICNVLGAIKTAKYYGLGPDDVVLTVATDGASLYDSEREIALARYFADGFDELAAAEVFGEHLLGTTTDHFLELGRIERERIFNLGYFTWVEQQGVPLEEFEARRDPAFWARIREVVPAWDDLIDDVNARTGVWRRCERASHGSCAPAAAPAGSGRSVPVQVPERGSRRRCRPCAPARARSLDCPVPRGRP